jgi:hypothetical protein
MSNIIEIPVLDKHKRYLDNYKPNDLYWALGLEEEFYLESSKPVYMTSEEITTNQKQERYSVNYRTSFKEPILDAALASWLLSQPNPRAIPIPLLVNSHSLTRTDRNGEPQTTYSKNPKPNPAFCGKTVHEELCDSSVWLRDNYGKVYCYDGNTIEIMTQGYYKATAESVCRELYLQRSRFFSEAAPLLNKMPAFKPHGPIILQRGNYGLATYLTSSPSPSNEGSQVNLCNNGTLHVNLTMPTLLNEECWPSDIEKFREQHLQAIRLIQWLEPLLVAVYGEPDFLSSVSSSFSKASQRCAISRYISISNYDTKEAKPGKILSTREIPEWYRLYHKTSAYRQLEEIGFDIQFNKFPRHGIELRIFDRLPDNKIRQLVRFLVLLLDRSLELAGSVARQDNNPDVSTTSLLVVAPQSYDVWTNWLVDILRYGKEARPETQLIALYEELIGCKLPGNVMGMFDTAFTHLEQRFATSGYCSSRMLSQQTVRQPIVIEKKKVFCC